MVIWLNNGYVMMGIVVGGGQIMQSFHVFSSFSDYLLSICALILLSARIISLWGAAAMGPGMYQGTGFTGLVCGTQSVISLIVQQ